MNLTTLSLLDLYELNLPLRAKLDARLPLSVEEQELHSAICSEVLARLDALRQHDRQERDERLAERYQRRPACEISQDEAASLNTFYSGVDA